VRYRSFRVFSLGRWTSQFPTPLACGVVLRILRWWLICGYGTLTPSGRLSHAVPLQRSTILEVLQPRTTRRPVWASPLSLATTRGIFSSPRGTQMFHFPRFPLLSQCRVTTPCGFPHSDTSGYSRVHTPHQSFSQCTTSFIGTKRPGIPRMLLFALTQKLSPSAIRGGGSSCRVEKYSRSLSTVLDVPCVTFRLRILLLRCLSDFSVPQC
jgi:hypothetical protein